MIELFLDGDLLVCSGKYVDVVGSGIFPEEIQVSPIQLHPLKKGHQLRRAARSQAIEPSSALPTCLRMPLSRSMR